VIIRTIRNFNIEKTIISFLMNIIKFGGSILNPDGKYNPKVIQEFIKLVQDSKEKFIFVVGGGKLCRLIQSASQPFLTNALKDKNKISLANDELGLAVTKINASYVLDKFKRQLKSQVYPEIILDPTQKVKSSARIFFAGGWKPGCSTDKDMMMLAEAFQAKNVFKITDFPFVKKIKPLSLLNKSKEEKEKVLNKAENITAMNWEELQNLVGTKWVPGLNTPFDPEAVKIGLRLRKRLTLYIGKKEEFSNWIKSQNFRGTVVKD